MTAENLERLEHLCKIIPPRLRDIPEADFSFKPGQDKWSKKEILGHLIDSATNNHHRFIRGQFEEAPTISYDQNKWNAHGFYNQINTEQLIRFWTGYNLQLVALIKHMPPANLKRECNTGGANMATLEWLFNDYVAHLEHHLRQILGEKGYRE